GPERRGEEHRVPLGGKTARRPGEVLAFGEGGGQQHQGRRGDEHQHDADGNAQRQRDGVIGNARPTQAVEAGNDGGRDRTEEFGDGDADIAGGAGDAAGPAGGRAVLAGQRRQAQDLREDEDHQQRGGEQDDAEHAGEVEVEDLLHLLDDELRDHYVANAAEKLRGDEEAERVDEDDERRRHHAGHGERKIDAPEAL